MNNPCNGCLGAKVNSVGRAFRNAETEELKHETEKQLCNFLDSKSVMARYAAYCFLLEQKDNLNKETKTKLRYFETRHENIELLQKAKSHIAAQQAATN